ncbi:hypothetical protein AB0H59_37195, partial [Streptomyces bacillaris]
VPGRRARGRRDPAPGLLEAGHGPGGDLVIALAYVLCLLVAVVALALALRARPVPAPPPAGPPARSAGGLSPGADADVRLILVTAAQLAARLAPAA